MPRCFLASQLHVLDDSFTLRAVLSCFGVVGGWQVRLVHLGSVVAAFVVLLRLFLLGSILSVKKMRKN